MRITFTPTMREPAGITIHDATGRRIRAYEIPDGCGTLVWDGQDDLGRRLAAGSYFLTVSTRDRSHVRRVALIR